MTPFGQPGKRERMRLVINQTRRREFPSPFFTGRGEMRRLLNDARP
jgi:hypothetical protein